MRRSKVDQLLADQQRQFNRERETWLAERRDLLDRIMYMAERPWAPPPAELRPLPQPETLSEEVAWPVVHPEAHDPEELLELIAAENGTE